MPAPTSPTSDDDSPLGTRVELAPGVIVAPDALRFAFSRSSGPGGQNVNKRSTKAELRVAMMDLPITPGARRRLAAAAGTVGARVTAVGELLLSADEERSQRANRDTCLERLRELLLRALPEPKVRRPTKPTKGSRQRRLEEKGRRGAVKETRRRPRDHD